MRHWFLKINFPCDITFWKWCRIENLFLETYVAWDNDQASGHCICQEASFMLWANERLSIYRLYSNTCCRTGSVNVSYNSKRSSYFWVCHRFTTPNGSSLITLLYLWISRAQQSHRWKYQYSIFPASRKLWSELSRKIQKITSNLFAQCLTCDFSIRCCNCFNN